MRARYTLLAFLLIASTVALNLTLFYGLRVPIGAASAITMAFFAAGMTWLLRRSMQEYNAGLHPTQRSSWWSGLLVNVITIGIAWPLLAALTGSGIDSEAARLLVGSLSVLTLSVVITMRTRHRSRSFYAEAATELDQPSRPADPLDNQLLAVEADDPVSPSMWQIRDSNAAVIATATRETGSDVSAALRVSGPPWLAGEWAPMGKRSRRSVEIRDSSGSPRGWVEEGRGNNSRFTRWIGYCVIGGTLPTGVALLLVRYTAPTPQLRVVIAVLILIGAGLVVLAPLAIILGSGVWGLARPLDETRLRLPDGRSARVVFEDMKRWGDVIDQNGHPLARVSRVWEEGLPPGLGGAGETVVRPRPGIEAAWLPLLVAVPPALAIFAPPITGPEAATVRRSWDAAREERHSALGW